MAKPPVIVPKNFIDFLDSILVIFQILTILIPSALLIRYRWQTYRTHQAMREWYKQQAAVCARKADVIRDHSLQDLFAIRRGLELAATCCGTADTSQYQSWIHQLEALHHSLNTLIDTLIPPYLADSLPLAITTYLRKIKAVQGDFAFSLQQVRDWEPCETLWASSSILLFFQGLEDCLGTSRGIDKVDVIFSQTVGDKYLSVELAPSPTGGLEAVDKAHDLCRLIILLSAIDCQVLTRGKTLFLKFRWNRYELLYRE